MKENKFYGAYNNRIKKDINDKAIGKIIEKSETLKRLSETITKMKPQRIDAGEEYMLSTEAEDVMGEIKTSDVYINIEIEDSFSKYKRDQWLAFSKLLYENGFYDNMSDEEVRDMEFKLIKITDPLDSIAKDDEDIYCDIEEILSSYCANMELESSVCALRYFSNKYIKDGLKEKFDKLIEEYHTHNSLILSNYKSPVENFELARAKVLEKSKDILELTRKKMEHPNMPLSQPVAELEAAYILGKGVASKELIKKQNHKYEDIFNEIITNKKNVETAIDEVKDSLVIFISKGGKNEVAKSLVANRSKTTFNRVLDYWKNL
ncbi:hypothetical protein KQI77_11645 [Clostridium sp. MSJ-8]|uniref:hypothetical protein n=1 Tax=Clostridium sp. MSJ-8 TaxID=2841510 RepID=UPI001C0EF216|nr:hypothetical protein [Clostridium sp. MSJ-8]MBU5488781.1 hypothetical protein [Clostridium sp. MSJ-8]